MRQFILLCVGGGVSLFLFFMFEITAWIILTLLITGAVLSFGFGKINGRSFSVMIGSIFHYYWNPRFYLWRAEEAQPSFLPKLPGKGSALPSSGQEFSFTKKVHTQKIEDLPETADLIPALGKIKESIRRIDKKIKKMAPSGQKEREENDGVSFAAQMEKDAAAIVRETSELQRTSHKNNADIDALEKKERTARLAEKIESMLQNMERAERELERERQDPPESKPVPAPELKKDATPPPQTETNQPVTGINTLKEPPSEKSSAQAPKQEKHRNVNSKNQSETTLKKINAVLDKIRSESPFSRERQVTEVPTPVQEKISVPQEQQRESPLSFAARHEMKREGALAKNMFPDPLREIQARRNALRASEGVQDLFQKITTFRSPISLREKTSQFFKKAERDRFAVLRDATGKMERAKVVDF